MISYTVPDLNHVTTYYKCDQKIVHAIENCYKHNV
jgi:hypothetical protein